MEVPLTSFIDFVLKSGSPKMTCAKLIKEQMQEVYDPAKDYYKRFRDAVQEMHIKKKDKSELSKIIGLLPDSKNGNYQSMISGYKKFLGTKETIWFQPVRKIWAHGNLQIPINPELGLKWNNQKYIIKLYLKSDKLSKDRISSILALMKHTIPTKDTVLCLLDVRNSKIYPFEENMLSLLPLVEGEARSLELILDRLK